jgi:hypothetical protein
VELKVESAHESLRAPLHTIWHWIYAPLDEFLQAFSLSEPDGGLQISHAVIEADHLMSEMPNL